MDISSTPMPFRGLQRCCWEREEEEREGEGGEGRRGGRRGQPSEDCHATLQRRRGPSSMMGVVVPKDGGEKWINGETERDVVIL